MHQAINLTIIENLRKTLPPTFTRNATPPLIGNVYKYQTLCNMDNMGKGAPSTKLGNRVIYEKESFLEWLSGRLGKND